MNVPVMIAYCMLLFETIYIILQGGNDMTSSIVAAIIAAVSAVVVAVIGNLVTFFKGRHNEKNEHDSLSKEHNILSKEHNSLSKEHTSILTAQKEYISYLEKITKEQVAGLKEKQVESQTELRKLSDASIRMAEVQNQVKEQGVDVEKMIANIRELAQMNAGSASQIQKLVEENRSLRENQTWMQKRIQDLEEQLREKDRIIQERPPQQRDEPDWDFGR